MSCFRVQVDEFLGWENISPFVLYGTADEACSREGAMQTISGKGKREKVDSHPRSMI